MNNGKVNIIRKQTLNLHYNGKADGFVLQKDFTDWYYQELFPQMQTMMDEIAPGNVHVRLDKLKIDLVIQGTGDWKQTLRKQVIENLSKQLQSGIHYNGQAEENFVIGPAENFLLLLTHYLQKGFLPWWSSIKTKNEFDASLEEWLLSDDTLKHVAGIKAILSDKDVVYRIAMSGDKNFDGFIKLLTGGDLLVQDLGQIKKDVSAISKLLSQTKKISINLLLKQAILENVTEARHDLKTIAATFVNRLMIHFADELKSISPSLIRSKQLKEEIFIRGKEKNIFQPEQSSASGKKETGAKKKDDEKNIEDQDTQSLKDNISGQTETSSAGKNDISDPGQKKYTVSRELKEGVFVNNAGLVIVANFLPVFFKKSSLLSEGNEITDKSKAAMLVQYLASGKENIAEFELGLAKILCGLEIETPVDTTILISTEEKEEVNELLLSVIEYWSILKNTSVQGLRDSFLLREGKLSFNDKGWLLQVEQKSFDILLQQLPWNISMIKLPWMRAMMRTEWFN